MRFSASVLNFSNFFVEIYGFQVEHLMDKISETLNGLNILRRFYRGVEIEKKESDLIFRVYSPAELLLCVDYRLRV